MVVAVAIDKHICFYAYTVQLKGNLIPACGLPGEHAWVNLQTGVDSGAGARNVPHQPGFDQVS